MKLTLNLAGIPIDVEMAYSDYLPLYENYISDEKALDSVSVSESEICRAAALYTEYSEPAYVEHMELCPKISNALLKYDRVFFHATAFEWRGRAWMLTAPPGTGKTTQYCRWKMLYGDDVRLLNGDKPILECGSGGVTVHHSPWRGKENMGQEFSAPLGGIIILEQAKENRIERLGKEAIVPVFTQFLYRINRDSVKKVSVIEDKMLRSVPVFKLYNLGDEASVRLCRDALEEVIK